VDLRNTILALHTGTALALANCAAVKLHTFNDYWQNGTDLKVDGTKVDQPGAGELFVDPRFTDPDHHDYRPQGDSPIVDQGDPSDPTPPGTGARVDIGYVQAVGAAVYASPDYGPQGLNDGLEWGVDAFARIGDAVAHVPDVAGQWTVGVAPGSYGERVALPSGVTLVGSGAGQTTIDAGGSGSALTLDGVTNVAVRGFTLQNAGASAGDAILKAVNASNSVTVTHNVLAGGNGTAALFAGASSGVLAFNTLVGNAGTGLVARDTGTWVQARFNIVANNGAGLDNAGSGRVFDGYNLFFGNPGGDAKGSLSLDPTDIRGQDPLFDDPTNGVYSIGNLASPAIDAIPTGDFQPVPVGGGDRADLGYVELLAGPVSLMLGQEAETCGMGAAGIASVEVGLSKVADASTPVTWTLPTAWSPAQLATAGQRGSYWNLSINPNQGDGLYRLYTRAKDQVGNLGGSDAWFATSFVADGTPPTVSLLVPVDGAALASPVLQLSATALDTVPVGTTARDNLRRVHFLVDGQPVTATLQSGALPTVGKPQSWAAYVPVTAGSHSVQAVATDRAGNTTTSPASTVNVALPNNVAALAAPVPNSAVSTSQVKLVGYASFLDNQGNGQVEVLVDGSSQGQALLDTPLAAASRWTKTVTLSGEGSRQITLRASRTAGGSSPVDSSVSLVRDTIKPTVVVQAVSGTVVRNVTLSGSATDSGTGVAGVAVSVDGGHTWRPAATAGNSWTYAWQAPAQSDFAAFPVRVRATDGAGNVQVQPVTLTVDNLGPTPFVLSALTPLAGSHVKAPVAARIAWGTLQDGSGTVKVYGLADQAPTTVPPTSGTPVTGDSFTASFNTAGTWYLHLVAVDASGNQTLRHYGPWYVESGSGASFVLGGAPGERPAQAGAWASSIRIDGTLDLEGGEWLPATERLDVDPRSDPAQALWASFDATNLYLGWQDAGWALGTDGYLYLDTAAGGTRNPWPGPDGDVTPELIGGGLPFDADDLVRLSEGQPATLMRYQGNAWQAVGQPELAAELGPLGDAELRLAWRQLGLGPAAPTLKLLAFGVRAGEVTSVFPTNQPVRGPWAGSYGWSSIGQATIPNAGQPEGHHARLSLAGGPDGPVGPREVVEQQLEIENLDRVGLPGVRLALSTGPGLLLTDIAGYAGTKPPPGTAWTLDLGTLPPGRLAPLVVRATAADDLAGIETVSLSAELTAGLPGAEPDLARDSVTHPTDNDGPAVAIDLPAQDAALASGPRSVRGTAADAGDGLARVEVRVADGPWQPATGTTAWRATIQVPAGGRFTLAARATDRHGHVGRVASVEVEVDNSGPVATLDSLPAVLDGLDTVLSGTVRDAALTAVAQVEVAVDGVWHPVPGPYAERPDGSVAWQRRWAYPDQEGLRHSLAVRATDAAGNVGPATAPVEVTVDSVEPLSVIEAPQAGATVAGAEVLVWGWADDGWGVERVEVSLNGGATWQAAKLGAEAAALVGRPAPPPVGPPAAPLQHGPVVLYLPWLASPRAEKGSVLWALKVAAPPGELMIRSRAVDRAGNVEPLRPPVRVRHSAAQAAVGAAPVGRRGV
jgi:hypothetical protein